MVNRPFLYAVVSIFFLALGLGLIFSKNSYSQVQKRPVLQDNTLTIEAIALSNKWLFVFPDQNVASVNTISLPEKAKIQLKIIADPKSLPLEVPRLISPLVAKAGVVSTTSFFTSKRGIFRSVKAKSGDSTGQFAIKVLRHEEFYDWVRLVKKSTKPLTLEEYNRLAISENSDPAQYYSSTKNNLLSAIAMRYLINKR